MALNGDRTLKFVEDAGRDALTLVNAGADPSVLGTAVGDIVGTTSIPQWQETASLKWNSDDKLWRAGLFVKYVGEVDNTSVSITVDEKTFFYEMKAQTRANVYVTRRDFMGYENLSLSFGINNIFDQDPPLADTTFGYDGSLHSSRARYFYTTASFSF